MKYLTKKGIMSKIFFDPVHLTKFYSVNHDRKNILPITEKISDSILTLPLFPGLKKEEMNYICDCIDEFFESL